MKKFLLVAALVLSAVFYAVSTNYELVGINTSDGFVLNNNDIQTNLYSQKTDDAINMLSVSSGEGIYERFSSVYYGDNNKIKANTVYPMFLTNSDSIKLLSGNETLITNTFKFIESYKNLIISDSKAFNFDNSRSDFNDYILVRLSNGLYVNTSEIKLVSYEKSYSIKRNSIIYFTPENIYFYEQKGIGTFDADDILGISSDAIISFDGLELSYSDLLLKLGETVEYHKKDSTSNVDEDEFETDGNDSESSFGKSGNASSSKIATKEQKPSEKAQKNEAAKAPEAPDDTPESSTPTQTEYKIVYPEWELPNVELSKSIIPGVYTLDTFFNIYDPAGVIRGGLVFVVKDASGNLYNRYAFNSQNGNNVEMLIGGLKPNTTYSVYGYYECLDKYGRPYEYVKDGIKYTDIQFLQETKFTTKDYSELGDIKFAALDNSSVYGDQISINNVTFTNDSDKDAISSLSKVSYRVLQNTDLITADKLNTRNLSSLKQMKSISITTKNGITSNSEYDFELYCYDMYGNELNVANNTISTRTCKKMITGTIAIDYDKDEKGKKILHTAKFTVNLKNEDNVTYTDLRLTIFDSAGNKYINNSLDYVPVVAGEQIKLDNFGENVKYSVLLTCVADNGDGSGSITREITNADFTTSDVSELGDLYLNINNVSITECPDNRYEKAILTVRVGSKTNSQLLDYVDHLAFTFYKDDIAIATYNFDESEDGELDKLKAGEMIHFDTDNLGIGSLDGNCTYRVRYSAVRDLSNSQVYSINVYSAFSEFKTIRKPPQGVLEGVETAPGYLSANIRVIDVNGQIIGNSVLVQLKNKLTGSLVATMIIDKNQESKQIILSNDSSISYGGISYEIEDGAQYEFQFIAVESYAEDDSIKDYDTFDRQTVTIGTGVTGSINLAGFSVTGIEETHDTVLPNGYKQVEYIETTGNLYFEINYIPSNKSKVVAHYYTSNTGTNGLFGVRPWPLERGFAFYTSGSQTYPEFGNQFNNFAYNSTGNHWVQMSSTGLYIDGVLKKTYNDQTFTCPYNMYVFSKNQSNSASEIWVGKLYYLNVYEKDTLKVELVPCYNEKTSTYGLYDKVNNVFYTKKGSGTLKHGNFIDSYTTNLIPDSQYNAKFNIDIDFPTNWSGNNDFYVDIFNGAVSDTEIYDTLTFSYIASESDETSRVYDVLSSLTGNILQRITLSKNSSSGFEGSFNYIVDQNSDKTKKYVFELYTKLLGKYKLDNAVLTDTSTRQDIDLGHYKEDLIVDINSSNIETNKDFYLDIIANGLNYGGSKTYTSLAFKYKETKNSKLIYDVYNILDYSTPLYSDVSFASIGSNIYEARINYLFDVLSGDDATYSFYQFNTKLANSSKIPLDKVEFSTEEMIYTISTIQEFINIGTSNKKYVVVKDLVYKQFEETNSTKKNPHGWESSYWNSSNPFNAKVDFQGHSLTYEGYSCFIGKTSSSASISNLVYKTKALYSTSFTNAAYATNNNVYEGILVTVNYGKLSNIYLEYEEQQPEEVFSDGRTITRKSNYFTDGNINPSTKSEYTYAYMTVHGGLTVVNYGTIENFVADIKDTYNGSGWSAFICCHNFGTVRNGYLFSSTASDHKATMNIYSTSSFSSNNINDYPAGAIVGGNDSSGTYVGVVENCYALVNINNRTGISSFKAIGSIVGKNVQYVRNTFSNGNVLTNNKANASNGPALGYVTSALNRNSNNNYMSDFVYDNVYNIQTSTIALRSASWVNDVLNVDYKEFIVEDMIQAECYPQVKLNDCMPAQPLLDLPALPSTENTDILFSEVYKFDIEGNEELDAILTAKLSGNDLGDVVYGEDNGNGYTSGSQVVKVYVSDKTNTPIYSLDMIDPDDPLGDPLIQNVVLYQTMDDTHVTQLYIEVFNPKEALNEYHISGIFFTKEGKQKKTPSTEVNRELNVSYTKLINTVEDWKEVLKQPTQNHRLGKDLDFSSVTDIRDVFLPGKFSGVLDGNGHTIKNIKFNSGDYASLFATRDNNGNITKYDIGATTYLGLFSTLTGTVKNLTIDNIYIEGGDNVGTIAGYSNGAVVENVFIKNANVSGSLKVGGFFAISYYTDISNSGIVDSKLICVGGGYNSDNIDWKPGVGGLIHFEYTGNNIERSFVSNVYIESLTNQFTSGAVGGLVGVVQESGNKINGCYAAGVINSNAFASGGLIGENFQAITINSSFSDVDVNSYFYNAGGIAGATYANIVSESSLLVFGDVKAETILTNDGRASNFKWSANTYSSSSVNAIRYDKAKLTAYYEDENDGNPNYTTLINGATHSITTFTKDLINDETSEKNIYTYLGKYFKIDKNASHGILPKLVDLNGEYIDNQPDIYISAVDANNVLQNEYVVNDIEIKHVSLVTSGNTDLIYVDMNVADGIEISDIYTDYSYISGSDVGVNSLANNRTFSLPDSPNDPQFSIRKAPAGSDYQYRATIYIYGKDAYYDFYKLTAIKYVRNKQTNYLKLNYRLVADSTDSTNNVSDSINSKYVKQFAEVSDIGGWNKYVAGSITENFKITGNINLSNYNYQDDNHLHLVINRLEGNKTGDYKSVTVNNDNKGITSPYYIIQGSTVNNATDYTSNNYEHGWIYNSEVSFIRTLLSSCKNISFNDINITSQGKSSLIANLSGVCNNVSFTNISLSNTRASRPIGCIGYLRGSLNSIYLNKVNVTSNGSFTGALVGMAEEGIYGVNFENIYVDNSKTSSPKYGNALIVGRMCSDYTIVSKVINFKNITIENSSVYSSGEYGTGALIGEISNCVTTINVSNVNVNNTNVTGYYKVGGLVGSNNGGTNLVINNCYVYKSNIKATYTGDCHCGGVVGYIAGNVSNVTVDDCTITGYGNYTGGLFGYNSNTLSPSGTSIARQTFSDDAVQNYVGYVTNSRIYGNAYVAGGLGYQNGWLGRVIITDCEIKGNTRVAGICGQDYQNYVFECVVNNSTIMTYKNATDAKYGPAYNATQSHIGGIAGDVASVKNCIVTNCFIGGENANYVGGLVGGAKFLPATNVTKNNSVTNSIVIGNNLVGGLFGMIDQWSNISGIQFQNCYTNAFVYGNSNVGGIAGYTRGVEKKDSNGNLINYQPSAVFENIYFTGALTSKTNAGGLFGYVLGNASGIVNNSFRYVSAMPVFIKAKTISPLFCDSTSTYAYKWQNISNDTSNIAIGLYSDTLLYFCNESGEIVDETTMHNYLYNSKDYSAYLANNLGTNDSYSDKVDTLANVISNFNSKTFDDGFIVEFNSDSTSEQYINDNFKSFILNTYASTNSYTSTITSIKQLPYVDQSSDGYMPFVVSDADTSYLLYSQDGFVGNRYHGIKNPFTNTYRSINIQQGVSIPGTDKYSNETSFLSTIYNLYQQYGTASFNIDISNYNEYDYSNIDIDSSRLYRNLPSEYTQVEYIETDGNQYINLGYKPTLTLGVEIEIASTGRNSGERIFFGASDGNAYASGNNFCFEFSAGNQGAVVFPQHQPSGSVTLNKKYNFTFNINGDQKFYLDGKLQKQLNYSGKLPNYNLYLGTRNIANSFTNSYSAPSKIYKCKIYDYNSSHEYVLLRDLVPCYRIVNNAKEYGMYDFISDTFFGNIGSGSFKGSYGIDINGNYLPDFDFDLIPSAYSSEYTQVEYIETDGNQYINLGYKPSLTLGVDIDIASTGRNSSERIFFGASDTPAYAGGNNFCLEFSSSNTGAAVFPQHNHGSSTALNKKYNFTLNINGDQKFYIDGKLQKQFSYSGKLPNYNLYLGTRNIANGFNATWLAPSKIYRCKIYDYNSSHEYVLLRDLVPCYRIVNKGTANEKKEYGMFDLVSNSFFGNAGKTGAFTGGKTKDEWMNSVNSNPIGYDSYIEIYQSDINQLSIDVLDNAFELCNNLNGFVSMTYSISNSTSLIDYGNIYYESGQNVWIKNKTINLDVDFNSYANYDDYLNIRVVVNYKDGSVNKTIDLVNLNDYYFDKYSTMSLFNGNIYYLYDDNLYINNVIYGNPDNPPTFISIFGNCVMNDAGTIYKLENMSIVSDYSSSADYLYRSNYGSNNITTYGTYSIVDGEISSRYKLYVKNNHLIVIDNSTTDSAIVPIYASVGSGKSTILMLSKDGKVYSIGNTAVLSKFTNFKNENIVQISSNLNENSSNPYIGFTYENGDVYVYDFANNTNTYKKHELAMTQMGGFKSLGSFLKTSLSGVFSFGSGNTDEELSSSYQQAETITTFLNMNGLSLGDVASNLNETNDSIINVANAIKSNDISSLNININDTDDIRSDNDEFNLDISIDDSIIKEFDTDTNEAETVEIKDHDKLITDKSIDDDTNVVAVFNKENMDFDIIDVNQLLDDPENVVSENSKVLDKSTLKALYNELGESQDNTTRRGIIFYILIALAIILLITPIGLISKKLSKKV